MTAVLDTGAGEPIVLLHGAGANRMMWQPVAELLADEFRVVAPDLAGHGSRAGERFDLVPAASSVFEVLDRLDIRAALVGGLSLGGYVALQMAELEPGRIRGLALSGATASYRGWGGLTTRLYGYVVPLLSRRLAARAETAIWDVAGNAAQPIIDAGLSLGAAGRALRVVPGPDYRAMVTRYPGRITLINGERDTANRREEADFLGHRPDTEVVVIEDAGHACALSRPEHFAAALTAFARRVGSHP